MIGPLTGQGEGVTYICLSTYLSIDMKTKVVQHVPRINISISHKRCDMGKVKSDMWLLSDIPIFLNLGWGGGRGGGWTEVIKSMDDLSVSRNKIIRNSTQKISSRVLNSRNMMSVARTSSSEMTPHGCHHL